MSPHDHRVLIPVSRGYPRLEGRLPMCSSPVCRSVPYCYGRSLDLHALNTPPTFVLSQDQTLNKFEMTLIIIYKYKENCTKTRINLLNLVFKVHIQLGSSTKSKDQRSKQIPSTNFQDQTLSFALFTLILF